MTRTMGSEKLWLCHMLAGLTVSAVLQGAAAEVSPLEITQDMLCIGCEAMSKVLHADLSEKDANPLSERVDDIVKTLCFEQHYPHCDFIPPVMNRFCEAIMEKHRERIRAAVMVEFGKGKPSAADLHKKICERVTKSCAPGYRPPKPKKFDARDYQHEDVKIPHDAKIAGRGHLRGHTEL